MTTTTITSRPSNDTAALEHALRTPATAGSKAKRNKPRGRLSDGALIVRRLTSGRATTTAWEIADDLG